MTRIRTWSRGQRRLLALFMLVALCAVVGFGVILPVTKIGLAQQAQIEQLSEAHQTGAAARAELADLEEARDALLDGNWQNAVLHADSQNDADMGLKAIVKTISSTNNVILRSAESIEPVDNGTSTIRIVFEGDSAATALFLQAVQGHLPRLWINMLQLDRGDSGNLVVTMEVHAVWLPLAGDHEL